MVLFRKIDGGFYMPPESMQAQRNMIANTVAVLIAPQLVLVVLMLRSVWRKRAHRLGRIAMAARPGGEVGYHRFRKEFDRRGCLA